MATTKKNTAIKQETKKVNKLVSGIIAVLVVLPLCYLVYFVNIEKVNAAKKADTADMIAPADTSKLQQAITLAMSTPNETNYVNLSLQYFYVHNYVQCVEASKKALEYNPKSFVAYNNICSAYNNLGMWDKAIIAGKMALEIKPGNELATANLKVSTDGQAGQDKQIADAETLAKTSPNEKNYMSLGNIYYSAKKFAQAIASFKKVLGYNSKNIAACNNICSANNELGNWKEAAEYCEKALKIDSTFTLAKNNLNVAKQFLK